MVPYLLLAVILVLGAWGLKEIKAAITGRSPASGGAADPLYRMRDPREAAAVLLVRQVMLEGQVTAEHKAAIVALMREIFGADAEEAEGLYSFGRMAVGRLGEVKDALPRLLRPIKDLCTLAEMKELVFMLEEAGAASGPLTADQEALIAEVSRALSLPSAQESA